MLPLSTAILCGPQLLLVDELFLGLAPMIIDELMKLVKAIRDEQHATVLFVEQNALASLEISDYGYVLENGRIVYTGDPKKLKSHRDVQEFYLGRGTLGG